MTPDRWEQIERLCHATLEEAPDARRAFLDEACRGDGDLRDEIESLLAGQDVAAEFLATPVFDRSALDVSHVTSRSLVGRRLGSYVVEASLGAGGMGEVFRAHDTKLDRAVAVKTLAADSADPEHLARFDREARILAALTHPAILTVHDVGVIDGIPFVVTELLEGQTLREVLARRLPTPRHALDWALQVAGGLAAAHRQGIVHRDLKPENLFLTNDGRMKILDFGLATRTADRSRAEAPMDATGRSPGLLLGTVAYMSPEQVEGHAVDARADVFAFGIVLHELLTGWHPFLRDSLSATLTAILHESPPPPDAVNAAVPAQASAIVQRCLAKRREDRYVDASDLVLALADVCAAPGVVATPSADERSPYPGLRSFTEHDAHVFVGREDEVNALWTRIPQHALLAVIGPSGAGKTSFVRAGVVPARPDGWGALVCTPGPDPMRSLGQALAPALASDPDALPQLVAFDAPDVAVTLMHRWRRRHREALVVVDQFEELFTLNPSQVQAQVAVVLGRLVSEAGIHLVLSLRDDFLIRCCDHPVLAPVLSHLTPVLPLGRDALRRALVEPAATRGYHFEPADLVDEMVNAVDDARAALPLLAFAVARLWERRDRALRCLTRDGYVAIGGVAGALAQRAEEVLAGLGPEREPVVRELFRNLVTAHATRAVIDRDELLSVASDRATADDVLGALVDARLITSYEDAPDDHGQAHHRVEIAHESLLTAWPRLVRWRAQDDEGALLRDHLRQAAHLWDEKGRMPDLLWTGTAYREYALWRERYTAPLSALESAFAASMTERARRKKRLALAAAIVAFAGLAAVAAYVAASRQRAVESASRANASKLVALGRLELDRFPTAAVAYARKSLEVADTIEARLLALEALWRGPVARTMSNVPCGPRLAFDPAGARLACAGFMPAMLLVPQDGRVPASITMEPSMADTREVVFIDGGRRLLTWLPGDGRVRMLDQDGREVGSFPGDAHLVRLVGDDEFVTCGSAPNGRDRIVRRWSWRNPSTAPATLDTWTPRPGMRFNQPGVRPLDIDGRARWLAYGSGTSVFVHVLGQPSADDREIGRHARHVREVQFDPSGDLLLSTDESGGFQVRTMPGGALRRGGTFPPMSRFSLAAFHPRSTAVAWMNAGEGVNVWALDGPPDVPPLVLRQPDADYGGQVAFGGDAQWLASGMSATFTLWPLSLPHSRVLRGHGEGPIERLVFSPDGRVLASCARDGARLWHLAPEGPAQRRIELGSDYMCYDVAISPDSRTIAIASPFKGLYVVPVAGGPVRRLLDFSQRRIAQGGLAFDATGSQLAVSENYVASTERMQTHVVDLRTGRVTSFAQRAEPVSDPYDGAAYDIAFTGAHRLLMAGRRGVRWWSLPSGHSEPVLDAKIAAMSVSADQRHVAVVAGQSRAHDDVVVDGATLSVLDLEDANRAVILGTALALTHAVAIDARGERVVTGDASGALRVSRVTGGEPHLLLGHAGRATDIAVSPDGKWIASASASEIRLWPMPDLTRPPFHTLPYEPLMQTLRDLTNIEVVADASSVTGYRLQVGRFRGWSHVPTW